MVSGEYFQGVFSRHGLLDALEAKAIPEVFGDGIGEGLIEPFKAFKTTLAAQN